jgi:misacylated tRNA(Ala) deacylase
VREFDACVVEVHADEGAIVLDQTAFYPGGGGQPCDTGVLTVGSNTVSVTKVKSQGGQVWHWIDGDLPSLDASVRGRLDWERRYRLMRTHTALHILCGVVWRDYGAQVTGGNMEPLKGRMDFEFESLRQELVHEIEAKVNSEVQAAREVYVKVLPRYSHS